MKINSSDERKIARLEFKYVLDPVTYMRVRDFIDSIGLEHDRNVSSNPYFVTSLYFDSVGLDDYYDKAGGFIKRKKVRVRVYSSEFNNNVDEIHFEIKNKDDMFVSKDRIGIKGRKWDDIVSGGFTGLSADFDYYISNEGRIPTVIVRYEREAFDSWFYGRVRLTFDKNIEAINPTLVGINKQWYNIVPFSENMIVMEVKFGSKLPWWFSFMVKKFDLQRTAFSKYSKGIDAIYHYDPLPR